MMMFPGLAMPKNGYSIISKELASYGFIVFTIEFEEIIRNPSLCREENLKFRN